MLGKQCSVWPDPVVAVVYVPTLRGHVFSVDDPTLNGSSLAVAVDRVNLFYHSMHMGARPPSQQMAICGKICVMQ